MPDRTENGLNPIWEVALAGLQAEAASLTQDKPLDIWEQVAAEQEAEPQQIPEVSLRQVGPEGLPGGAPIVTGFPQEGQPAQPMPEISLPPIQRGPSAFPPIQMPAPAPEPLAPMQPPANLPAEAVPYRPSYDYTQMPDVRPMPQGPPVVEPPYEAPPTPYERWREEYIRRHAPTAPYGEVKYVPRNEEEALGAPWRHMGAGVSPLGAPSFEAAADIPRMGLVRTVEGIGALYDATTKGTLAGIPPAVTGPLELGLQHLPGSPGPGAADVLNFVRTSPNFADVRALREEADRIRLSPFLPKTTAVGETIGGFAPLVLADAAVGPAGGVGMIMAQTLGHTIDQRYDENLAKGMRPDDAAKDAVATGTRAAALQGLVWGKLSGPMKGLTDRFIIDKLASKGVNRFVAGRIAQAAHGYSLGVASQAAQNVATGRPVTEGIHESGKGLGLTFALSPRGYTAREVAARRIFGPPPGEGMQGVRGAAMGARPSKITPERRRISAILRAQAAERVGKPVTEGPMGALRRGIEGQEMGRVPTEKEFFGEIYPAYLRATGLTTTNPKLAARRAVMDAYEWGKDNPKFQHYYEKDMAKSRDTIERELGVQLTDPQFRMWRLLNGLTSQAEELEQNTWTSINGLKYYLDTGNFDTVKTLIGPKKGARRISKYNPFAIGGGAPADVAFKVGIFNNLMNRFGGGDEGITKAIDYLEQPVNRKELDAFRNEMGYKGGVDIGAIKEVTDFATGQTELFPRMMIMGPKVGPYTLNNLGDGRWNTMDVWDSREFKSYMKGMLEKNPGIVSGKEEREIARVFLDEFNRYWKEKIDPTADPSSLQAIRWFYMIDTAKRAGYTRAIDKDVISQYVQSYFDAGQPQFAEGGKFQERGGGRVRAEPVASGADPGATHQFFSSYTGEPNKDVQHASDLLLGLDHHVGLEIAKDLHEQLGLPGTIENGLGDTANWAVEPSIVAKNNTLDRDQARYHAALLADLNKQDMTIPFRAEEGGSDVLHNITVPTKDIADIQSKLYEAGLLFRTFLPDGENTRIVVFDQGGKLFNNIAEIGGDYGIKKWTFDEGWGEFIGGKGSYEESKPIFEAIRNDYEERYPGRQHYQDRPDDYYKRLAQAAIGERRTLSERAARLQPKSEAGSGGFPKHIQPRSESGAVGGSGYEEAPPPEERERAPIPALVWKDIGQRGTKKLQTPDGKYEISLGFVGNWRGHTGQYKELGWEILKKNQAGTFESTGVSYPSLARAKAAAAERAKEYGYDHIGYTVEERNAMSAAARTTEAQPLVAAPVIEIKKSQAASVAHGRGADAYRVPTRNDIIIDGELRGKLWGKKQGYMEKAQWEVATVNPDNTGIRSIRSFDTKDKAIEWINKNPDKFVTHETTQAQPDVVSTLPPGEAGTEREIPRAPLAAQEQGGAVPALRPEGTSKPLLVRGDATLRETPQLNAKATEYQWAQDRAGGQMFYKTESAARAAANKYYRDNIAGVGAGETPSLRISKSGRGITWGILWDDPTFRTDPDVIPSKDIVRLTFKASTESGGTTKRTVWARKMAPNRYRELNEEGDWGGSGKDKYIMVAPADIISEEPAGLSKTYGTLKPLAERAARLQPKSEAGAPGSGRLKLRPSTESGAIGASGGGGREEAPLPEEQKPRAFGLQLQNDKRLLQDIKDNIFNRDYTPIPNKVTAAEAAALVDKRGIPNVMANIQDESNGLQFHIRSTMGQIVIQRLNETAARLKAAGDTQSSRQVQDHAIKMSEWAMEYGTRLGQGVQSFAMWNRLSPEGKLMSIMRMTKKTRDEFTKRNGEDVDKVVEGVNQGAKTEQSKIDKMVARQQDKIARQLSDTPTWAGANPVKKNEILELIRAHLKERQEQFVERMDQYGVGRRMTESIDRMAAENRRRIDVINNAKEARKRAQMFDDAADKIAQQLSDTPTFRSRGQPDLAKQLIKDHLKEPQPEFVKRLVELGADEGTAHTIDRLAMDNRERILEVDRAKRAEELRKQYTPKNKVAKKLQKAEWEKLVELADHGLLTDKSFMDTAAERLGLPRVTPEVQQKVLELAGKIRDATEGLPRNDAIAELNRYTKSMMGYKFADIPTGIYYANMLSGYNTHLVNLVDTALNVNAEINNLALANPKSATKIWGGALRGFGEGTSDFWVALSTGRQLTNSKWLEVPDIMEAARFGVKGGVPPILPGTVRGRVLHAIAESPIAYPLRAAKYVGRLMGASDALMYRTAKEAKASLIADRVGREEGLRGKELDVRVQELLGTSSDLTAAYRDQATQEGYTGALRRQRISELRGQARGIEANADAENFAGATTYNEAPRGWLGHFSNAVDRTFAPLPFGRAVIIPFTKIVANVTNRKLDYFPVVGHLRAIRGYYGDEGTPAADERSALMARAHIGTAAVVGLAAAQYAGLVQIHGGGPSDTKKRKQLIEEGWRPYTMEVGGKYYSYMYTPPGLLIASLGNVIDMERYQELKKKDKLTRAAYVVSRVPNTVFNQSFLNSFSNLFDALSVTDPERSIFAWKKFVSSTVGSFTTPRIVLDVQRIFDPTVYDADTIQGTLLKNTPFASLAGRPVLNAFGEKIAPPSNRFIGVVTKDLAWQTVIKANLLVPLPSKSLDMPDGRGGKREITPAEYYELVQKSGPEIRKWIISNGPALIRESQKGMVYQEKVQEVLSSAAEKLRKQTHYELYSKALHHPVD